MPKLPPDGFEYELEPVDFERAKKTDGTCCVIAQCIKRVLGTNDVCVGDSVSVDVGRETYEVLYRRTEFDQFIKRWDNDEIKEFEPLKFELSRRYTEWDSEEPPSAYDRY